MSNPPETDIQGSDALADQDRLAVKVMDPLLTSALSSMLEALVMSNPPNREFRSLLAGNEKKKRGAKQHPEILACHYSWSLAWAMLLGPV